MWQKKLDYAKINMIREVFIVPFLFEDQPFARMTVEQPRGRYIFSDFRESVNDTRKRNTHAA